MQSNEKLPNKQAKSPWTSMVNASKPILSEYESCFFGTFNHRRGVTQRSIPAIVFNVRQDILVW
jgi:hypothetical protein